MLLTSPLLVTVGLSLTIPVSLLGQMILNSQTSSVVYWIGAGVVFLSFVFINYESKGEEEASKSGLADVDEQDGSSEGRLSRVGAFFGKLWDRVSPQRR